MCGCDSAFACVCGFPRSSPGSGTRALREDHPEALFSQAWKQSVHDAWKPSFLQGRSSSQPMSACKTAFGSTLGGLTGGEGQFCSEARNARVRAEHGSCPWPALQRYSWLQRILPPGGAGCGCVSDIHGQLHVVISASAFPLGLGPRLPWRGGVDQAPTQPRPRGMRALSEEREEQLEGCSSPCSPRNLSAPWGERGPLCP